MSEEITKRKPRADAERNRQRLLEVAKEAFAERGMSASLEEIARTAQVGIGTLYRHFPTREALVNEIYRDQGIKLTAAAQHLMQSETPIEALRKWLLIFIESLENKQIMAGVLSCMTEDGDEFCELSGEVILAAFDSLLEAANQKGYITTDIESLDILCAIAGIASYGPPGWEVNAKRLVEVLIAGLSSGPLCLKST